MKTSAKPRKSEKEKINCKEIKIMNGYLVRNSKNNGVLDVFDDAFDSCFKPMFYEEKFNKMKTDIKQMN